MYSDYAINFKRSIEKVTKMTHTNENCFRQKLTEIYDNELADKLTLEAYLIMPVQRIPRYRLMMENILKFWKSPSNPHALEQMDPLKVVEDMIEQTISKLDHGMQNVKKRIHFPP